MKGKMGLILFTLLYTALSFGKPGAIDQKILHFSVDISKSYGEIFATYNDMGDIESFKWKITHPQDPGEPGEEGTFTAKDIREGTVFKSGLPKKFVKVWGDNFSSHNGGLINIRVPGNILTGKHTFEKVDLDRLGDDWKFNHASKEDVQKIELKLVRFLGLPVGIKGFEFLD